MIHQVGTSPFAVPRQWDANKCSWVDPSAAQVQAIPPSIVAPPESIRVGHMNFALKIVPAAELPTEKATYGCCDCGRLTIFIQKDLPPALTADSVAHECFHAIFFAYGIPTKIKEERACLALTGPILAVARDNPALVAWLATLLKG